MMIPNRQVDEEDANLELDSNELVSEPRLELNQIFHGLGWFQASIQELQNMNEDDENGGNIEDHHFTFTADNTNVQNVVIDASLDVIRINDHNKDALQIEETLDYVFIAAPVYQSIPFLSTSPIGVTPFNLTFSWRQRNTFLSMKMTRSYFPKCLQFHFCTINGNPGKSIFIIFTKLNDFDDTIDDNNNKYDFTDDEKLEILRYAVFPGLTRSEHSSRAALTFEEHEDGSFTTDYLLNHQFTYQSENLINMESPFGFDFDRLCQFKPFFREYRAFYVYSEKGQDRSVTPHLTLKDQIFQYLRPELISFASFSLCHSIKSNSDTKETVVLTSSGLKKYYDDKLDATNFDCFSKVYQPEIFSNYLSKQSTNLQQNLPNSIERILSDINSNFQDNNYSSAQIVSVQSALHYSNSSHYLRPTEERESFAKFPLTKVANSNFWNLDSGDKLNSAFLKQLKEVEEEYMLLKSRVNQAAEDGCELRNEYTYCVCIGDYIGDDVNINLNDILEDNKQKWASILNSMSAQLKTAVEEKLDCFSVIPSSIFPGSIATICSQYWDSVKDILFGLTLPQYAYKLNPRQQTFLALIDILMYASINWKPDLLRLRFLSHIGITTSTFKGMPHILSDYIVRQKREIVSYIDAPYVRNTSLYFRKRGIAQKHHVTLNRVYEDIRCLGERLKSLNFNNQQAANRLFKEMFDLYKSCVTEYVNQFAYIKAVCIRTSKDSTKIANALRILTNSNGTNTPEWSATRFLTGSISGLKFFQEIATYKEHPMINWKPKLPITCTIETLYRQHLPPLPQHHQLHGGSTVFNWRKLRSIPESFTAHRLIMFFFEECDPFLFRLPAALNRRNESVHKLFFEKFKEIFKEIGAFPLLDTAFPNNIEFAIIKSMTPSNANVVYSEFNQAEATQHFRQQVQLSTRGQHRRNIDRDATPTPNNYTFSIDIPEEYQFEFSPSDNDWKKVFNDCVLPVIKSKYIETGHFQHNRNEFFNPVTNDHKTSGMHVQYCALASMMLTTLQVRINSRTNPYGCVRSSGTDDNSDVKENYSLKKGPQRVLEFKRIVNANYCSIMYLFILVSYGFIRVADTYEDQWKKLLSSNCINECHFQFLVPRNSQEDPTHTLMQEYLWINHYEDKTLKTRRSWVLLLGGARVSKSSKFQMSWDHRFYKLSKWKKGSLKKSN